MFDDCDTFEVFMIFCDFHEVPTSSESEEGLLQFWLLNSYPGYA
jgi:hypothetical protein